MDEIHVFTPPCHTSQCFCLQNGQAPERTKPVFALLTYQLGKQKFEQDLMVNVPVDYEFKDWRPVIECAAREFGKAMRTRFVSYRVQLDGKNQVYTWRRQLQDWFYRLTLRGQPFTRTGFVPIWDEDYPD